MDWTGLPHLTKFPFSFYQTYLIDIFCDFRCGKFNNKTKNYQCIFGT